MTSGNDRYIIEFHGLGNSVKVTAFDTVSLMEASIVGDKKASPQQLSELAIRKLHYVMEKQAHGQT